MSINNPHPRSYTADWCVAVWLIAGCLERGVSYWVTDNENNTYSVVRMAQFDGLDVEDNIEVLFTGTFEECRQVGAIFGPTSQD